MKPLKIIGNGKADPLYMALYLQRLGSDVGRGVAARGSLNAVPVRFAKRISFKYTKWCSACRLAAKREAEQRNGNPRGAVPRLAARTDLAAIPY